MPAMDAIAGLRTTGGGGADAAYNAVVVAPGDSTTVRNFTPPDYCELIGICASAPANPLGVRIRSPFLHDIAEGIQIIPGQSPSANMLPRRARQRLRPQDTLTFEIKGSGTASPNVAALMLYYSNLPGAAARLHTWSDIQNLVAFIKVVQVTAGGASAVGVWYDNSFTLTEDLTHANTDYAVLGYVLDGACTAFGVRGVDTGNLRVVGPGVVDQKVTTGYFVDLSIDTGLPTIPILNSANKNGISATFLSSIANITLNGQLILAQLGQNLS